MISKTAPEKLPSIKGFSLTELLIAVLIFGMIIAALTTLYGTSHKHMMQNFRETVAKNSLTVAFKTIQQDILTATRIDTPPSGGASNSLAYAKNIASDGCYPIDTNTAAEWTYVCLNGTDLWMQTGTAAAPTGCPDTGAGALWTSANYPIACGLGVPGEILLLENAYCPGNCFSRTAAEDEQVRLRLTVRRPATSVSRAIDETLETVIKISMAKP